MNSWTLFQRLDPTFLLVSLFQWSTILFLTSPRNDQRTAGNLSANTDTSVAISNTFLFIVCSSPYDVIEHRQEDNSSMELRWVARFVNELLDFVDELQCGESWENSATRIPSVLRQLIVSKVLYIVVNLWINVNFSSQTAFDAEGSDSPFQDITQNLKTHKSSHARYWWLLHHSTKDNCSHGESSESDLRRSTNRIWLFHSSTLQTCRKSVLKWDLSLYFLTERKFSE